MPRQANNPRQEENNLTTQLFDFMKFLVDYSIKNRTNLLILFLSLTAVLNSPPRRRTDTDIGSCTETNPEDYLNMCPVTPHDWACQRLLSFQRDSVNPVDQRKIDDLFSLQDQIKSRKDQLKGKFANVFLPGKHGKAQRHEYRIRTTEIAGLKKERDFRMAELTPATKKQIKTALKNK